MKRIFTLAILASLSIPVATAAPKAVPVQLGSIYSTPTGTELFLQSGKNSIFITNINAKSADIQVVAVDLTGNQPWQRTIDSGSDEVVTAATLDSQ